VYDVGIVGGGIVGLATAHALLARAPGTRVLVLEKEARVAQHQTGHNSGVVHSGLYYRPGSSKARLCVEGSRRMLEFCAAHGVSTRRLGKVIVATAPNEVPRLEALYARGIENGVSGLARLDPSGLRALEPQATGLAALHVPGTAVVDYARVAAALATAIGAAGAEVVCGATFRGVVRRADGLTLLAGSREDRARVLVNCAGLHSDAVARLAGVRPDVRIIPFRGEYYALRPERTDLVRGLIYPVPDPAFPFLGVHFTRTVDGHVEAGPNAVLAFAREGYRLGRVSPGELADMLRYRGFWPMVFRYWRTGLGELARSLRKRAFVAALQRLVPAVQAADLVPGGAGVRAQAVARDGALVDDFRIVTTPDAVHVLNAPSPAATASLAIGDTIAALVTERLRE
jgi:(S)-2-hydroxyglutarate dehydrogenase